MYRQTHLMRGVAGLLIGGLLGASVHGQDGTPFQPPQKPYKLSVQVPPLRLPDLDGKLTTLVDEDTENVSAVIFWSLRDPVARSYLPKLEQLRQDLAGDGVQLFLINSNRDELTAATTDPLEKLRKFVRDQNVRIPILVDMENVVADDFGAVCANHTFVLGSTRKLVYRGAIDNDPRGKLAKAGRDVTPYLREALEAAVNGDPQPELLTSPTGRPIKRWPKVDEKPR